MRGDREHAGERTRCLASTGWWAWSTSCTSSVRGDLWLASGGCRWRPRSSMLRARLARVFAHPLWFVNEDIFIIFLHWRDRVNVYVNGDASGAMPMAWRRAAARRSALAAGRRV